MTGRGNNNKFSRRNFLQVAAGATAFTALPAARAFAADEKATGASDHVVDVAILGGGLAGLTAARDLQRAGCESFVVLEAMDRVGGRTLNHDLGNDQFSEAGGQWIGPGQTAIADLTRELGIGTFPTYYQGKTTFMAGDGQASVDLGGTFGTDMKIAAKLDELARGVPSGAPWKAERAAELDKMSLGDWLAQQGFSPEDRIGWSISSFLTGGVMPAKMGFLHFLSMINSADSRYDRLDSIKDSAQETRISGGSQVLSLKMAEALGDKVRTASPVRRIRDWDQSVVTLETDTGIVHARQIILAMSPAMCQQIDFDPVLPTPRQELQRQWPAHSPARKVAHVYKKPFWRDKGLNGHIMQAQGPIFWAYDNSPEDASIGVINAFVAQSMLPADHQQAEKILSEIYARALGEEALHPIQYHDHDWGQDPWILSCVSAIPPGFWTQHGEALHPSVGRLIWSGTETAEIWAGYMDGAVRSGHRAALQALNNLRRSA
ncbi:FAD-dependent oxidoreductase [Zhongshania sp.]|uniref:flavin monoamine oxidase family protein n=1 Tax=Zhongshania sp. TaxID=1971902 RepID=UPI001B6A7529|nr:FAD-dependent oxidoreductase [Zhongshania sp.]MBQ0797396.1 FAD-dependent oxidoreductase [Zhongshania sp.]